MPADPPVAQPYAQRYLALLLDEVHKASDEVSRLRRAPLPPDRLAAARQSLLAALESYAAELTARRLPVPPRLRDDLRLQRSIGTQPGTSREGRQAATRDRTGGSGGCGAAPDATQDRRPR